MRKEAHFVKSLWFRGEWVDDVIYALLARSGPIDGPKDSGKMLMRE